jgi:hypothetical protein
MNDTPETDGEWNRIAYYDHPQFEQGIAEFARKLERERDTARDKVRNLAVALATSIRSSLAKQDEAEQAMAEQNELRILVDGLMDMNQSLSEDRNLWQKEAKRWREINK